jgi:cell fate (sporulation/competence/biofilm development) regulator YmcA (YheA/YmcA/DUF963 family)
MEACEQEVESIRTLPEVEETTEKQIDADQIQMMMTTTMTTTLFKLIMTLSLKL